MRVTATLQREAWPRGEIPPAERVVPVWSVPRLERLKEAAAAIVGSGAASHTAWSVARTRRAGGPR